MSTPITMRSPLKLTARHLAFARSPEGLFVILAASLFVAEVFVMLLLAMLPTMPPLLTNVLDATILVVLAFPALRAFAFGPLLRHLRAREETEAQLQEANRTLEQRVQERTHELQTANESLSESEARYRTLAETAQDIIYIINREFCVEYINEYGARQFGRSTLETTGRHLTELFSPETTQWQLADMADIFRTGEPVHRERQLPAGQRLIWLDTRLVPVKNATGEVESILGISRDITERQRVQQERERLIADLQTALADVKQLGGLLPICAGCKQIRDDRGYWSQVESYIAERSEARFTHSLCPICTKKFFPDLTPEELDTDT